MHALKQRFEGKTLEDHPQETRVVLHLIGGGQRFVIVPTSDVFVPGDWLSRRFAGINLRKVEQSLRNKQGEPKVLMINISRGEHQLDALRLESANPSFVVIAQKQAD